MRASDYHPAVQAILASVSQDLGPPTEIIVNQHRVNLFAASTGDDQWIHVDAERAAKTRYGGTIAHGFLTISFIGALQKDYMKRVEREYPGSSVIHCSGSYKLLHPVRVGETICLRGRIAEVKPANARSVRMTYAYEISLKRGKAVATGSLELAGVFK